MDAVQDAVPISEAGKLVPGRPATSTLWRWAKKGCRGVRLETFSVGSRRYVTREAIARFIEQTTAAANTQPPEPAVVDEPADLPEATKRRLRKKGLLKDKGDDDGSNRR